MKKTFAALFSALLLAGGAQGASCGTIAVPTACSVTVGAAAARITYTFSAFNFLSSSSGGGGKIYNEIDVLIDVAPGGGSSAVLTFSKNPATPGLVFFANPGETSGFTFSYNMVIAPAIPGGVSYSTPFTVSSSGTRLNNGSGTVQLVVTGATPTPSCQSIVVGTPSANCVIAAGQPLLLTPGNIVSLFGGAGTANVTIGSFSNQFDATFTPLVIGLDIDGNGSYDALTDGLLLVRYMLGLRGTALTVGATAAGAPRTTAALIEPYIKALMPTLP